MSAFCLIVTYIGEKSRTRSYVKGTCHGQGHFSEDSRSLGKVMSHSVTDSEIYINFQFSIFHLFLLSATILVVYRLLCIFFPASVIMLFYKFQL